MKQHSEIIDCMLKVAIGKLGNIGKGSSRLNAIGMIPTIK
jgi:hypothetical protein